MATAIDDPGVELTAVTAVFRCQRNVCTLPAPQFSPPLGASMPMDVPLIEKGAALVPLASHRPAPVVAR